MKRLSYKYLRKNHCFLNYRPFLGKAYGEYFNTPNNFYMGCSEGIKIVEKKRLWVWYLLLIPAFFLEGFFEGFPTACHDLKSYLKQETYNYVFPSPTVKPHLREERKKFFEELKKHLTAG